MRKNGVRELLRDLRPRSRQSLQAMQDENREQDQKVKTAIEGVRHLVGG